MDKGELHLLDTYACAYYSEPSDETLNEILLLIESTLLSVARKYTNNADDLADLMQILRIDVCNLVSVRWTPIRNKPFHRLFLLQLRNKSINHAKYIARNRNRMADVIENILKSDEPCIDLTTYHKELLEQIRHKCHNNVIDLRIFDLLTIGYRSQDIIKTLQISRGTYRTSILRIQSYASDYRD